MKVLRGFCLIVTIGSGFVFIVTTSNGSTFPWSLFFTLFGGIGFFFSDRLQKRKQQEAEKEVKRIEQEKRMRRVVSSVHGFTPHHSWRNVPPDVSREMMYKSLVTLQLNHNKGVFDTTLEEREERERWQRDFDHVLGIYALSFKRIAELQEKKRLEIDALAKEIGDGKKNPVDAFEAEGMLHDMAHLDARVDGAKKMFWELHGYVTEMGFRTWPKMNWYTLPLLGRNDIKLIEF